jgi:hypothetical protein
MGRKDSRKRIVPASLRSVPDVSLSEGASLRHDGARWRAAPSEHRSKENNL